MILLENRIYLIFTKPLADVFLVLTVICLVYIVKMQKDKKKKTEIKEEGL